MPEQPTSPSLMELILSKGVTVDHKDFHRLLLEALDDTLDDLLSKRVRVAFYDHLERNYYFGKEDIPKRLGDFLLILERTFGTSGQVIERAIAKRLATKLGQQPQNVLIEKDSRFHKQNYGQPKLG